jgi:hypothetical protein
LVGHKNSFELVHLPCLLCTNLTSSTNFSLFVIAKVSDEFVYSCLVAVMEFSYLKGKDKMIRRSQYKDSGWKKVQVGNGSNMEVCKPEGLWIIDMMRPPIQGTIFSNILP